MFMVYGLWFGTISFRVTSLASGLGLLHWYQWRGRNPFSQWERSFLWKLHSHWLKDCDSIKTGPSAYEVTHFTNNFSITIQIRRKFRLAVIHLLVILSQQNFVNATTAQLPCHVQNFVAIISLEFGWEQNEISITFELWWKIVSETAPWRIMGKWITCIYLEHCTQSQQSKTKPCAYFALILGLCPANERHRYFVMTSPIGWAQA